MNTSRKIQGLGRYLQIASLIAPLLFSAMAYGQSGRRAKPASTTQASPTPAQDKSSSEQTTAAAEQKPLLKVNLLVGRLHTKKRLATEDVIYGSFVKRLNELIAPPATQLGELTNDQAVERAKRETESYLLLLQFEIDMVQDGRLIVNSPNLEVFCIVYERKTGKKIAKDRIYYQPLGGMGTRTSGPGALVQMTPEATGITAAEQLRGQLLFILNPEPASLK
jgi:hypothetical protein